MYCIRCNERPVENKDTGLCATCGADDRKLMRQNSKPKKSYSIRKVSEQGKRRQKEIKETYKVMDATSVHICSSCGTPLDPCGSHSHLCPRSQYPEYAAAPWNIVYDCPACHYTWEHGSWEQVQQLGNIRQRIKTLLAHCQTYLFRRFILKNPKITLEILEKY